MLDQFVFVRVLPFWIELLTGIFLGNGVKLRDLASGSAKTTLGVHKARFIVRSIPYTIHGCSLPCTSAPLYLINTFDSESQHHFSTYTPIHTESMPDERAFYQHTWQVSWSLCWAQCCSMQFGSTGITTCIHSDFGLIIYPVLELRMISRHPWGAIQGTVWLKNWCQIT